MDSGDDAPVPVPAVEAGAATPMSRRAGTVRGVPQGRVAEQLESGARRRGTSQMQGQEQQQQVQRQQQQTRRLAPSRQQQHDEPPTSPVEPEPTARAAKPSQIIEPEPVVVPEGTSEEEP
ncbi:MAG: hypothetical protein HY074_07835, partial [Deltaproteobacteria bacterium]|nr:hypothetical protein [Deltaproteobacteria bacterium]